MCLKNRSNTLFFALTFGSSAISFILRLLSVTFFYDPEIGYYTVGAILPTISNMFFVLSAIALAFLPFFLFTKKEKPVIYQGVMTYAAFVPAVAMAVFAVVLLIAMPGDIVPYDMLFFAATVVGAVFFASIVLVKQPSALTLCFGIGFILWLAICWLSSYTDFTVAMNSPDKLFFHFSCIGAALLTVAELKIAYGMADVRQHRCYMALSILSLSSGVAVSVVGDLLGAYSHNPTFNQSAVLCTVLIYAVVRSVFSFSKNEASLELDESTAKTDTAAADSE